MESWKQYEPYPVYSVSTLGRVRNDKRNTILNPSLDSRGYKKISVGSAYFRRTLLVHKMIAETFVPNPDDHAIIDHINRDKMDNRVENLRWTSQSENCRNRDYTNKHTGERCIYKAYGDRFKVLIRGKGEMRTATFDTLEEAKSYRDIQYRELWG